MSKVVDIPRKQRIREEAAEWLIRLDSDKDPSAEELALFRDWLGQSTRHRVELERLATHWDELNVLTELAVPIAVERQASPSKRLFTAPVGLAAAMAAIVLLTIGVLNWPILVNQSPVQPDGLYATAVGQQQTIELEDSSTIDLNTNTQVQVDYTPAHRVVRLLQGEAHFEVASDPDRPFRVLTSSGYVEAIGTAFSVRLREQTVDVTVTEGRVKLSSAVSPAPQASETAQEVGSQAIEGLRSSDDGQSTIVSAGQVGVFPTESGSEESAIRTLTVTSAELTRRTAWKSGLLMFSGEPLSHVVSEISRYTTVQIDILDPEVRSIRIGGQFPVGETDLMLESLETNFGLTVTHTGPNTVVLAAARSDAQ